ncbi:Rieske (2Fe-2S) protein [Alkalilimnicola sp. S0819]|uniref:Rieske (2Fe-2S) protein n=1 Tax=Alkalilimnicola sp. S0819 TaxID=2613922 RepID=UPI00126277BE|nr:Rieske 2Fe-2S domain-containing protein [Alkalilimnicola sp. S0819]KAB7623359.1 Rieske 2Fe-2S domain-containing protein [Alkalilimnicola sp. S0819]MPQ16899.1 Rieske 2Fe-2S domain-containing protein [Alkalilimnicola sp. S0819]
MQRLCALEELPENQGRGFEVAIGDERLALVLVRRGGWVYGYRNVCPHRGTSLDWMPDRFMDPEGEHLQCATHDARFRVEDGFCVSGPCAGAFLGGVELRLREGAVYLMG